MRLIGPHLHRALERMWSPTGSVQRLTWPSTGKELLHDETACKGTIHKHVDCCLFKLNRKVIQASVQVIDLPFEPFIKLVIVLFFGIYDLSSLG